MNSPDILSPNNSQNIELTYESRDLSSTEARSTVGELSDLQDEVMSNLQKPNIPNVNVPEKIIICLDICYNNQNSLFRLGDGTTFTPINMIKRVVDFFVYSKHAINKNTEFALITLHETEPYWIQDFTKNIKDILNAVDYLNSEECTTESFDFNKIIEMVKHQVEIPEFRESEHIFPPPYIVRMIVLYGRANCVPLIPQENPYFMFLKKQLYFYIDILLAHEEDCAEHKCEEIYDALQDLDNGYSYVYEVSRNATKIHDSIAKLLAHPLQRPLQKNTDYSFSPRF